ncbi:MAG: endothelin-converting protein [Flavobacteria bacterium RIFCSPLOWO2_12_FULL_35_11]|nr:MAG: endothelin-converting protein [Flavobacteria bacterium RIFCSPLOWO2_12_FULL_35_11]
MNSNKLFLLLIMVVSISYSSRAQQKMKEKSSPGLEIKNMDKGVSPSNDFFRYVNGAWLDKAEIPADRTSWGSFNELRKKTDADVLEILNEAIAKKNAPKLKDAQGNLTAMSDQEKAVNYYESIMDTEKRNSQGINPVLPFLAKIDAVNNLEDLNRLMVESAPYGGVGFYNFYISNDLKNSNRYVGYVSPAGLGLSRDYYVDQDDNTKLKREKYIAHIAKMLQFYGDSKEIASQNAQRIFNYEYNLAKPRMTKEESRDRRKSYNPKSIDELTALTSTIHWNAYFTGIGIAKIDTVVVSQPKYMATMDSIIKASSIDDIKLYLKWKAIDGAANMLSDDIEVANWEFYSKELTGAMQQLPRNERALASINGVIGEALGKLYVDKKFPPEAKAKAMEMIKNVMAGYEIRIQKLPWMSDATKQKALEKLHKLTVKIAYPDKWKDYSALVVVGVKDGGSYFQNSMNARKWNFDKNIAKLGNPVDRTEWGMSPQTVNAYFNATNNEIVFPAAILQPPFYNYLADEAVNYGGIGAVIGHEISHSFDDSGSRFDGDGNLVDWWTTEDLEKFTVLGTKLADQYSAKEALPEVYLNGKYNLGENIGDLGGVNAALEGLELFYKTNGKPEKIDGFTAEQRFFISWATVWRTKMREDALRNLIKTDPHAPGMFRAYMPLTNVDAFYDAFNIKPEDKMYLKPDDRVKIW